MNSLKELEQKDIFSWICPDLTTYWQLSKIRDAQQFILKALEGNRCFRFSRPEGLALQHFTGHFTVEQVQNLCCQKLGEAISPNLVVELLEKLVDLKILDLPTDNPNLTPPASGPRLKPGVSWFEHPDGHWIVRNREDMKFLQVDNRSQAAIEQLGHLPPAAIIQQQNITPAELRYLLQLLAATGMLEGTTPAKPPKRKFTPLSLLFFKVSLFNPDKWLTQHIDTLRWIWTRTFGLILCFFLAWSFAIGLSLRPEVIFTGQQLIASQGTSLILPFALLAMLVVTLHELGHAFTLKHYDGIIPEVGLLFMFLVPAAYTNTTDLYCLMRRRERSLVVAAGVICQITIAAIAFWLWRSSANWLATASYLTMVAALFTVAINLNPLAKFDGYYLAVALSGINNLRERSFKFYANLLRRHPSQEKPRDTVLLATYAPFSLLYTLLVFGSLFAWVSDWTLTNIPFWALTLLSVWAIYFYWPQSTAFNRMNSSSSDARPQLKVVQPKTTSAAPKTSKSVEPVEPTAAQSTTPAKSYRGWAILSVIATGLGLVSFIPTPFEVGGAVELKTREGAREVVRTPIAGVVTEINVKPGQSVQRGQVLAKLSSWELDREIAAVEQQSDEARITVEASQKQLIRAQAQLVEVSAAAEAMNKRATRERERAMALTQGKLTPEIQELEQQQQRLQQRLAELGEKYSRYQYLYRKGAISKDRRDEIQAEQRDVQSGLAAKTKEIEAAKQKLTDTASDLQAETVSQQASISASQMIAEAEGQMAVGRNAIATLEKRLKQLKTLRESLTLHSPMTGVILTSDLDLKKNQELKPGEDFLLEIAELKELTAIVEVREEDLEYVQLNKPVTFRPRQAKLRPYNATVKMILPKIESEPDKPTRTARVQIVVDNRDGKLSPGASGYAKIWSEQIPLYQRLSRELQRLVPFEKFL